MTQESTSVPRITAAANITHCFASAPLDAPSAAVLAKTTYDGADTLMIDTSRPPSRSPSRASNRSAHFTDLTTAPDPSHLVPPAQVHLRSGATPPTSPLPSSPRLEIQCRLECPLEDAPASSRNDPSVRPDVGNALRLKTDIYNSPLLGEPAAPRSDIDFSVTSTYSHSSTRPLQHKASSSSLKPVCRTPSTKATGFYGFGASSAASSPVPSPVIAAMGSVTPLPSPLMSGDSPGPWRKLARPQPPHEPQQLLTPGMAESTFVTSNGESLTAALAHMSKRKTYAELLAGNAGHAEGNNGHPQLPQIRPDLKLPHTRNRSASEYIPDPVQLPKRMVTVSGTHETKNGASGPIETPYEAHMRREPHLSEARGLTPVEKPPTPPPSESSSDATAVAELKSTTRKKAYEYFEANGRSDGKRRRWRAVKLLGQGTFSRVVLATSQMPLLGDDDGRSASDSSVHDPLSQYDRRTLVAVKICEHGPKGGASEERVEMSLKRELEIMQCIHHPSLVHLKAWSIEPSRAILVLNYCPGGDLFDVASAHRDLLTPELLARIFAELVGAVCYLHERRIVHRDIKLENVLVNLSSRELGDPSINWTTYPYSVTTLTDLGLSRHVADDEKLETRCGSDDYAAPEVIMGQPYDGRATDAWSLGVLLYALLEGRLPFDPHPGMSDAHRMRSRTSHRIARVEWRWIEYAGEDGDHDGDVSKFEAKHLLGAMNIAEGLLKRARSRWPLSKVAEEEWVRKAMIVEDGLRFREEEDGQEVLQ